VCGGVGGGGGAGGGGGVLLPRYWSEEMNHSTKSEPLPREGGQPPGSGVGGGEGTRARAGPLLVGGACNGVKRWVLIGRKACECRWLGGRVRGGVVRVRSPRDCTAEARQDLNVLLGVREAASSI